MACCCQRQHAFKMTQKGSVASGDVEARSVNLLLMKRSILTLPLDRGGARRAQAGVTISPSATHSPQSHYSPRCPLRCLHRCPAALPSPRLCPCRVPAFPPPLRPLQLLVLPPSPSHRTAGRRWPPPYRCQAQSTRRRRVTPRCTHAAASLQGRRQCYTRRDHPPVGWGRGSRG